MFETYCIKHPGNTSQVNWRFLCITHWCLANEHWINKLSHRIFRSFALKDQTYFDFLVYVVHLWQTTDDADSKFICSFFFHSMLCWRTFLPGMSFLSMSWSRWRGFDNFVWKVQRPQLSCAKQRYNLCILTGFWLLSVFKAKNMLWRWQSLGLWAITLFIYYGTVK